MLQALTITAFKHLAQQRQFVAVYEELPVHNITPVEIYRRLSKLYQEDGVLLEDKTLNEGLRYASICFDALKTYTAKLGESLNPIQELREFIKPFTDITAKNMQERITTSVGFMSYDSVRFFEKIADTQANSLDIPEMLFKVFALSVTIQKDKKTMLISQIAKVTGSLENDFNQAKAKIAKIKKVILSSTKSRGLSAGSSKFEITKVEVDIDDKSFIQKVVKAKEYIKQGDAFQIVLSRSYKRKIKVSPLQIFKALSNINPSPFMFYFPFNDKIILGASPERLVQVKGDKLTVNPIAGTKQRGVNQSHSDIENILLKDEKELAEHMMLVDLARNDLGTICKPLSIKVTECKKIKHYTHVSHIVSALHGTLNQGFDAFDALQKTLPAGTLSGAPKIRAMQIIDKLEVSRRYLYGGAICRLDAKANLESCIAIRMTLIHNAIATIRTGAGIVHDSKPELELQETYQKAQSMLAAIAKAHGEDDAVNH